MTNLTVTTKPGWLIRAKTILHGLEIEDAEAFSRANILRQQIESLSLAAITAQNRLKALQEAANKPDSFYSSETARHQINVESGNVEAEIAELIGEVENLKQRAADVASRTAISANIYNRAKKIFNAINGNVTTSNVGVA